MLNKPSLLGVRNRIARRRFTFEQGHTATATDEPKKSLVDSGGLPKAGTVALLLLPKICAVFGFIKLRKTNRYCAIAFGFRSLAIRVPLVWGTSGRDSYLIYFILAKVGSGASLTSVFRPFHKRLYSFYVLTRRRELVAGWKAVIAWRFREE